MKTTLKQTGKKNVLKKNKTKIFWIIHPILFHLNIEMCIVNNNGLFRTNHQIKGNYI